LISLVLDPAVHDGERDYENHKSFKET